MGVGNTQITIIVNKALFNASAKSCSDSFSGKHFSTGGWKTPPPPAMLDQKKPGRIRVKQLDAWLQGNKLSLNVTKTHSMLITTKQKRNILKSTDQNLELSIRGKELDIVQKTK